MTDIYDHAEQLLKTLDKSPMLLAKARKSYSLLSPFAVTLLPYIEDISETKSEKEPLLYICHLYSIVKQGNPRYLQNGTPLFEKLNELRKDDSSLDTHVKHVLTSYNVDILKHNLERLVRIYRQKTLDGFDFARLSTDLYYLQFGTQKLRSQALSWGMQFYRKDNNQ